MSEGERDSECVRECVLERDRSILAHQSSASSAGSHGPVKVNHSRGLLVLIYSIQALFAVTYY